MARIFYIHWNREEAEARARGLEAAGHEVQFHSSSEAHLRFDDDLPDAVVISLDRLPSHGRAVAEWFWEAKKRHHIPLIFAGGVPDKVAATREKFPGAVYCDSGDVVAEVGRALAMSNL